MENVFETIMISSLCGYSPSLDQFSPGSVFNLNLFKIVPFLKDVLGAFLPLFDRLF